MALLISRWVFCTLVLTAALSFFTAVRGNNVIGGGTEDGLSNGIEHSRKALETVGECIGTEMKLPTVTELRGADVCLNPGSEELMHFVACWGKSFDDTFYDERRHDGAKIEEMSDIEYLTVVEAESNRESRGQLRKLKSEKKVTTRSLCRLCCLGGGRGCEILYTRRNLSETSVRRKLSAMPVELERCLRTHPSYAILERVQIEMGNEANEDWAGELKAIPEEWICANRKTETYKQHTNFAQQGDEANQEQSSNVLDWKEQKRLDKGKKKKNKV